MSYNLRHLQPAQRIGIKTLPPREFLAILKVRWVLQKLNTMNLAQEEKVEWEKGLADRKRAGMQMFKSLMDSRSSPPDLIKDKLEAYGDEKGCSLCEGAASAGEKCQIRKADARANH